MYDRVLKEITKMILNTKDVKKTFLDIFNKAQTIVRFKAVLIENEANDNYNFLSFNKNIYYNLEENILAYNVENVSLYQKTTNLCCDQIKVFDDLYFLIYISLDTIEISVKDEKFINELLEIIKLFLRHIIDLERINYNQKKSEEKSIAKTDYLVTLSHEIRTPMNGIFGYIQLLELSNLNNKQKNYIHNLKEQTDQLLELVNSVLDLSKIEASKVELYYEYFDLRRMIESIYDQTSITAKNKGLNLKFNVEEVPTNFLGDELRIKQILLNILNNSFKFTAKGYVSLKVYGENEFIVFEVKDTGIGIPQSKINDIFQPFVQANPQNSESGTGLGLAICNKLVNLMGGSINIESEVNKGTKISVYLKNKGKIQEKTIVLISCPTAANIDNIASLSYNKQESLRYSTPQEFFDAKINKENIDSIVVRSKANQNYGIIIREYLKRNNLKANLIAIIDDENEHLEIENIYDQILQVNKNQNFEYSNYKEIKALVVDDNIMNLTLLKELLMHINVNVDTASNGFEAVEMAKKKTYDIIFMDIQMPKLNGIDTAKIIQNRKLHEGLIIFCSGVSMEEAYSQIKGLENSMYLEKPLKMNDIVNIINECVKI